ncbi:helix-turn-helix domain-containing protein [Synechocystis sp. LEGE 06083]|uniref:helix-turn-helix domain-containing protein n=1 Tax=Synechocystis sp. LEGE 06083 TaxID=915336 RepID=UPI0018816BC9|nr:helix-turn-helix domain-containing protein [Synechocystis sp. LEGE 06083]MBE9194227.1 helix-turn-helix domain-containing protein [Synechocystis sp. LEGE 06083]
MSVNIPPGVPVFDSELDPDSLLRLGKLLEQAYPKLVGMDGDEMYLPESIYQILLRVAPLLAQGKGVSLIPQDHYLTTQETANLLNISRPYLYKLLDRGEIAFVNIGSHRRIKLEDAMEYRKRRDDDRKVALTQLIATSQELGFYENEATTQSF